MKQYPIAVSLFLCEQVIIQEGTRYITPVNCYKHRTVLQFPTKPFPLVLFAILRDGIGDIRLQILIRGWIMVMKFTNVLCW